MVERYIHIVVLWDFPCHFPTGCAESLTMIEHYGLTCFDKLEFEPLYRDMPVRSDTILVIWSCFIKEASKGRTV